MTRAVRWLVSVLLAVTTLLVGLPEGASNPKHPAKRGSPRRPKAASPAAAPKPEELGQEKLQAAIQLQQAGRLDEALLALEKLYAEERMPTALLHLGHIARQQARTVAAVDLFRRYLDSLTTPPEEKTAEELRQLIRGLTAPSIEASIVGGRGWLLRVDGRLVGVLPLPGSVLIAPGMHRFSVEHAKKSSQTAPIELPADRQLEISLSISPQQELISVVSLIPSVLALLDGEPMESTGHSTADTQRLFSAVRSGLSARRAALVHGDRLKEALRRPEFAGCAESLECQEKLGQYLKATYVLAIRSARSGDVQAAGPLSMRILDTRTRQIASERSIECPGCDFAAQAARLGPAVQELLVAALARPRGVLSLTSEPSGAAVRIDGQERGQAPMTQELFAGSYEITVEQRGYRPGKTRVEVQPGQSSSIELRLVKEELTAQGSPGAGAAAAGSSAVGRRPLWRIATGASLMGIGTILIGFGGSALAVNGTCKKISEPAVVTPPCMPIYETAGVGGGLIGAGAGALLGGAILIAWPAPRR